MSYVVQAAIHIVQAGFGDISSGIRTPGFLDTTPQLCSLRQESSMKSHGLGSEVPCNYSKAFLY